MVPHILLREPPRLRSIKALPGRPSPIATKNKENSMAKKDKKAQWEEGKADRVRRTDEARGRESSKEIETRGKEGKKAATGHPCILVFIVIIAVQGTNTQGRSLRGHVTGHTTNQAAWHTNSGTAWHSRAANPESKDAKDHEETGSNQNTTDLAMEETLGHQLPRGGG